MPFFAKPLHKSLWWFKLCWAALALTVGAALLHAPAGLIFILYSAAVLSGCMSAGYMERIKPSIVTDFFWFLVPAALFLFPIALLLHSARTVRIYRAEQRLRAAAPRH